VPGHDSYVSGILAAGTETIPAARPSGDAGAPAHLHGPTQLFADPLSDNGATVIPLPTAASSDAADMSWASSTFSAATELTSSEDAS
jgi:hypothetical protein